MPIDWFTVIAQVINFLFLVWLLQRFLYKPILRAIDEREKGIAKQLAEAEAKKAEAQKARDEFQHKNDIFDQERAALSKKATEAATAERQRLFDEARKDADALRAKRLEALRSEQINLNQEISRWTQKEVFAIARRTLTDLATVGIEERMGEVFVQRLRALTGESKEQLTVAVKTSSQPPRVRSAFDLPPAQRSTIESAINETFSLKTQVQFETAPEMISGIELAINGQKVAWSIADYLATLEKSVGELLREDAQSQSEPGTKPPPEPAPKPGPKRESKLGLESEPPARKAQK